MLLFKSGANVVQDNAAHAVLGRMAQVLNDRRSLSAASSKSEEHLYPGAEKPFPKRWGEPPKATTRDYCDWPDGFGHGSGTIKKWIEKHLEEDKRAAKKSEVKGAASGDTGKEQPIFPGAKKPFPSRWGSPPKVATMDMVQWPDGYGQGSGSVGKWIKENMRKDQQSAGDAGDRPALPGTSGSDVVRLRRVATTIFEKDGAVFYMPMEGVKSAVYPAYKFNESEFKEKVGAVGEQLEGIDVHCAPLSWRDSKESPLAERRHLRQDGDSPHGKEVAQRPYGGFRYPTTECKIKDAFRPEPVKEETRERLSSLSDRLSSVKDKLTKIMSDRAGVDTEEMQQQLHDRIAQHHADRSKHSGAEAKAAASQLASDLAHMQPQDVTEEGQQPSRSNGAAKDAPIERL
jgi:hypothetical protein